MMKQSIIFILLFVFGSAYLLAQDEDRALFLADSLGVDASVIQEYMAFQKYSDSLESTFDYIYDEADLNNGIAKISIPEGYKFLEKNGAQTVLSDIWGNPVDETVVGLLLKIDESAVEITYGIEITYSEEGYIEDDDAEDIDYDELLDEMKNDALDANPERKRLGYPEIELIGWASEPFYDASSKKLHWAKELLFEGEETNTLNYNIRVLGRKGYMNLNVIGDIEVLEDVKENLNPILNSVTFNEGYKYSEFDPDLDDVAAYGIGGLIAGKVLAKAGFFAVLLKLWKFIALGAIALFAAFKKRLFGSKELANVVSKDTDQENSEV